LNLPDDWDHIGRALVCAVNNFSYRLLARLMPEKTNAMTGMVCCAGLPPKRRIRFQVGNHLGDVVKESVLNTSSANSQRVHNLPHAGPRL
jgi:hypothetical protein